jgi:lysophospholipase L1-like esterase
MRQILHRTALVLVVAVICLTTGEITIRAFYRRLSNYNMEMWRYASDLKCPLDHPLLPFYHCPDKHGTYYGTEISINSFGFRDRECSLRKPENKKRVVFLGDSFTLGWGVPLDETFSKRVEKMLRDSGISCEVINMGVGNYNTTMEVELFKWKGLRLEPDLVVLTFFVNDTEPIPRHRSFLAYSIMRHSYLYAFLFDRFTRLRATAAHTPEWQVYYRHLYSHENAENLAMNTESVNELIELCSDNHIGLLIVSIPEMHDFGEYQFSFAVDYIRGLAEQAGIPFIDLLPAFGESVPESMWVSLDDLHANSRAHRVIGREIGNRIASEGLLR